MKNEVSKRILSVLRTRGGSSIDDLGYGFLTKQWLEMDPVPYDGFDMGNHPLFGLVKLGLVEAYSEQGPVGYEELVRMPYELSTIRFYFSKRALAIEEALGIRLDRGTSLFAEENKSVKWPQVFVLMPFEKEFRPIFDDHIKKVILGLGLTIERADDFFSTGSIVNDIWTAINIAEIIIADCTGRNPNVFYEIGIAHAIGKETVLITQSIDDIPFDLKHLRAILYKYIPRGMKEFEAALSSAVAKVLEATTITATMEKYKDHELRRFRDE